MKTGRKDNGFTVIELMAVLGLLTLLVMVAVPVMDSLMADSEAKIDDADLNMIVASASVAESHGVLHDEPNKDQYKIRTLVNAGVLEADAVDPSILQHWLIKEPSGGYSYLGEREETPAKYFTYKPVTQTDINRYAEVTRDPKRLTGVEITGYTGPKASGDIVIPEKMNGQPVTTITESIFHSHNVTGVYFPESIRYIKGSVFHSNDVQELYLPPELRHMDGSVFRGNANLKEVTFPEKLNVGGPNLFRETGLTSVDMSHVESLTYISTYMFYDTPLESVVLPQTGLNSIGGGAFQNAKLGSVIIPEGVTSIGNNAFSRNNLRSVKLPDSVTEINQHAFSHNGIRSLKLSKNVDTIGNYAFYMNDIDTLELPANGKLKEIASYAFHTNNLKDLIIPEGITSIGGAAFRNNQKLTSVSLPTTLKDMGNYAFYDNVMLSEVSGYRPDIIEGINVWGVFGGRTNKLQFN